MTRALGRYEIIRPLARGGMAELFLARRRGAAGVEKRVVLKRIRQERAGDPHFLELFVREARLSMALAHQNIVPVFDFGRAGDELFLAMEHVEGHDLAEALRRLAARGEALDPVLTAYIGAECCQALDYAHHRAGHDGQALGVVHRDVSARNVLISTAGEVKLVDFGVAALGGAAEGKARGTPGTMAPEQARGEAVDARADLYALALVLYEAVTGTSARAGADVTALLAQARAGTLAAVPSSVPEGLAEVIRRASQPEADARYADARQMHEALEAYVVTARAAHPELGSPARRLANWLRELGEIASAAPALPGGAGEPSLELPANATATFLDDGADAVLGRATQRSIAMTIADEGEAAPVDAASAALAQAPRLALAPPQKPHLARWALAAVAVAVLAGSVWAMRREVGTPGSAAPDAAVVAVAPAVPMPDAAPVAIAPVVPMPDAAPVAVTPAPPPPPGPRVGKRPPPGEGAQGAPSTAAAREVAINILPWANFWIDDDATPHQTPETVRLSPGKHVIRFENPQAKKSGRFTIDVPEGRDLTVVEQLDQLAP